MKQATQKVVIAGGGTAGWVTAAALAKKIGPILDITLIESDEIGTVGVGEATIPPMRAFHRLLGIDEQAFMRATEATFKLGIQFENWGNQGDSYIHSFGRTGQETWIADFIHFWLRGQKEGIGQPFSDYCFELEAARQNKFATSDNANINYAFHLDAGLYAKFLRHFSEALGVTRTEGKIAHVQQDPESEFITSVTLQSGQVIEGDLFIDCTGFHGLLIEKTLHTGYEDWSHWLPCDRAVAMQTELTEQPIPYTRSIAHEMGWQWQIPLQHRVGNGLVYCSHYMSDDEAIERLHASVKGKPINQPRVIHYRTGKRRQNWNKNCIAIGLASGFVEPLESTSIHLIMMAVNRLIQLFPFGPITQSVVDEYNEQSRQEIEKIRDFIILHYHVTQREDSPFWRYCRNMAIPESLQQRIDIFSEHAMAFQHDSEMFRVDSWTQVMLGQGIMPAHYHRAVDSMPEMELRKLLEGMPSAIKRAVDKMPSHSEFIRQYCASSRAK